MGYDYDSDEDWDEEEEGERLSDNSDNEEYLDFKLEH